MNEEMIGQFGMSVIIGTKSWDRIYKINKMKTDGRLCCHPVHRVNPVYVFAKIKG
jgi:hypothetical protein